MHDSVFMNQVLRPLEGPGDWLTTFAAGPLTPAQISAFLTALGIVPGVFTPTFTNVANLSASVANRAQYIRVGNVCGFGGSGSADAVAGGGTVTTLGVSLPITSDFTAVDDCGGTATILLSSGGVVFGSIANNRAEITWLSGTTANATLGYTIWYLIK